MLTLLQEYFCEVDEDYILDRFNLTGLNAEVVQEYSRALSLITDNLSECTQLRAIFVPDMVPDEDDLDEDTRESIETSARFLYGLIHARFIVTTRGLAKMVRVVEKYPIAHN